MNRNEYCDRVLAQVGRLTTDEANDLRNELAGHIEDHAEALVEHGYTEEDAAARAVELMGDPEETGRALRSTATSGSSSCSAPRFSSRSSPVCRAFLCSRCLAACTRASMSG